MKGLAESSKNILSQYSSSFAQAINAAVAVNVHGDNTLKSNGFSTYYPFKISRSFFKIILMNDEPMILKFLYSYADGKYQIIGAQKLIYEKGVAGLVFVQLKEGDKITPIFFAITNLGDTDEQYVVTK